MKSDFSFSALMEKSDSFMLSPVLGLDPKIAFLIAQSGPFETLCQNLGALGTLAVHFFTRQGIFCVEEQSEIKKYLPEYVRASPLVRADSYLQIITFGDSRPDEKLWNQLEVGGYYLLGTTDQKVSIDGFPAEPFGKLWPYGQATEWGWRFSEEIWGLEGFEFVKVKKLGRKKI